MARVSGASRTKQWRYRFHVWVRPRRFSRDCSTGPACRVRNYPLEIVRQACSKMAWRWQLQPAGRDSFEYLCRVYLACLNPFCVNACLICHAKDLCAADIEIGITTDFSVCSVALRGGPIPIHFAHFAGDRAKLEMGVVKCGNRCNFVHVT